MPTTENYSYEVPTTGDDSLGASGWMQTIRDFMLRIIDHTHDGDDSARLTSAAIDAHTSTTGTGWGAATNGVVSQVIAMPTDMEYDKYKLEFRTAAGLTVLLKHEKVTATSYRVYTNDATQNYTVLFTS